MLQTVYGLYVCSFFYECPKLWFPDVEVNSGTTAVPQWCRVMFLNINCLHGNKDELELTATKFDKGN